MARVVERRWTVAELEDEELLDVLAHCHGVLHDLVGDAHTQMGHAMETCAVTAAEPCDEVPWKPRQGDRLPCMIAGRDARTSRRDLSTGAPVAITVERPAYEPMDEAERIRRYSNAPWEEPASDADLFEQERVAHMWARRLLLADGEHITIAFLFRDGVKFGQVVMEPGDQRDKYLMMERLASVAAQSGADGVVVTSEAWEALMLPPDDPLAQLRPGQREDRGEVLLTHVLERGGRACTWSSQMLREDGALTLSEPEAQPGLIPQILYPVAAAFGDAPWEEHAAAEDA